MKKLIVYLFFIFSTGLIGQVPEHLKYISNRKITLPTYYRHSVYVKIDLVRELGVGYNFCVKPFFNLDGDVSFITPKPFQGANDYFYNYGYSINLSPKFFFHNHILFLGPSISFLDYGYKKKWTESQVGTYQRHLSYNHDLRDRKSIEFAAGLSLGVNCKVNRSFLRFFFTLNHIFYDNTKLTIYKYDNGKAIQVYNEPVIKKYDLSNRMYVSAGIQVGISRQKMTNPKHEALLETLNTAFAQNDSISSAVYKNTKGLKAHLTLNNRFKKKMAKSLRKRLYYAPNKDLDTQTYLKLISINNEFSNYFMVSDSIVKGLYKNYQLSSNGKRSYFKQRRIWYEKLKFNRFYSSSDTIKMQGLLTSLKVAMDREISARTMKPGTYQEKITDTNGQKAGRIRKDYYELRNRKKYKLLYETYRVY